MAEITLNIDNDVKEQLLMLAEKAGLTPTQFLKTLLQDFLSSDDYEELEIGEETKKSLLEGSKEFEDGKLKIYDDWREMFEDIKAGKND